MVVNRDANILRTFKQLSIKYIYVIYTVHNYIETILL